MVLTSERPEAVAEKTSKSLVAGVTGIFNPVIIPDDIVPRANAPVKEGAKVTIAPGIGLKVLSGVVD